VAAFVVWLCTDAAARVNGQDFVVSAEHVSLMSQPRPTATLYTDAPWTVERLEELLPGTLTRGMGASTGEAAG